MDREDFLAILINVDFDIRLNSADNTITNSFG
jgi:hypothetical protein